MPTPEISNVPSDRHADTHSLAAGHRPNEREILQVATTWATPIPITFIFLAVLALLLFVGCSSDDTLPISASEDAGSYDVARDTSTIDLGADLDATDAEPQTTPDMSTSDDMSRDLGRDTDRDEPECICPDPLATCFNQTGECVREDVDCGSGQACPDGYNCTPVHETLGGGFVCLCDGVADECGPFCDDDGQCPGRYLACDFNAATGGVCRQDISCVSDYECGPGFICERNDALEEDICTKAGDGADGTPCSDRLECASGICAEGICVTPCQANADCGSDEVCQYSVFENSDGCVPGTCPVASCDETQSRCFERAADGMAFCEPKYCETSADCENDCVLEAGTRQPGLCLAPESPTALPDCKPNEFKLYPTDPYCRLPGPCWTPSICRNDGQPCDDCPAGYECLEPDRDEVPRAPFAFCSRELSAE